VTAVIGIDCATQPSSTGLVYARARAGRVSVLAATLGSPRQRPAQTIAGWLANEPAALLALDAPLGWPQSIGPALMGHAAGEQLTATPNALFRRATDDAIAERLHKRPLDVGADRIARTAHAALALLGELRQLTGQSIPLAWAPLTGPGIQAIEVYPAATRRGRRVPDGRGSLAGLEGEILVPAEVAVPDSVDVRDAMVCALAGADFLAGRAYPPTDVVLAKKEGWIWVC
jgi:predicted nuclease with RNAse H fold